MNFLRKQFSTQQKEIPSTTSNLDANQRDLICKKLTAASSKGVIEREKFKELYGKLGIITDQLYTSLYGKAGKVTTQALLEFTDHLQGNCDEIAMALCEIFPNKETIISSLVDAFSQLQNISPDEKEKLLTYLKEDLPEDETRFGRWLHANPLMLPLIEFVFAPIYFESSRIGDIMPTLNTPSDILKSSGITVINAHLPMERRKNWQQLFSTIHQGTSFSQLTQKIDGQGPCLLVIESECGQIFGCFASEGFFTGPQYHGDSTSFLFTAHPKIQISNATGRVDNYAYMNYQQQQMPNGIGIGGHETVWPLFIHEDFGKGQCAQHVSSFEKIALCGDENQFKIKSIEAWRCGEKRKPLDPNHDGLEVPHAHKSVLDIDPQAKALLEMSGRQMHSDAYREPEPMLD